MKATGRLNGNCHSVIHSTGPGMVGTYGLLAIIQWCVKSVKYLFFLQIPVCDGQSLCVTSVCLPTTQLCTYSSRKYSSSTVQYTPLQDSVTSENAKHGHFSTVVHTTRERERKEREKKKVSFHISPSNTQLIHSINPSQYLTHCMQAGSK